MPEYLNRIPENQNISGKNIRKTGYQKKTSKNSKLTDNDAIAVLVNGKPYDLSYISNEEVEVKPLTFEDEEGKKIYWHSTAHILAQAVKHLFPEVKLAIGPAIENGFYYDFDYPRGFTPEDLTKIEKEMQKIISADYKFERKEVSKEEAIKHFAPLKENYKLEILNELTDSRSGHPDINRDIPGGDNISLYTNGDFTDLCQGPHISSTGKIKAFKLLKVAGAYWKGDEHNPMLQRIYGISYPTESELSAELKRIEEAEARDHRKLGKELELFNIFEEGGSGLVYWYPKGTIIKDIIESFWKKEHSKRGYKLVSTPHIAKAGLWKTSGHYDFYKELIATVDFDGEEYVLKPMNCPLHILIYKSCIRSYKNLPIRYAELGTVYRCERSGVLHGLLRVRGFTQDDAHIFCRPDQIKDELIGVIELAQYIMQAFGFSEYEVDLSVRDPLAPQKYVGTNEDWEISENALIQALQEKGLTYRRKEGEAVFYGPKIDIMLRDAIGRRRQATTIQLDFNLPRKFGINYIGADDKPHYAIMIHRAILGSLERFFGCLIEHYKGAFPYWLSPVQVIVATVSEGSVEYAGSVYNALISKGVRAELDSSAEKIGFKIRTASVFKKVPYILIIGNKEVKEQTVAVRERKKGDIGAFKLEEFIGLLQPEADPPLAENKENVSI